MALFPIHAAPVATTKEHQIFFVFPRSAIATLMPPLLGFHTKRHCTLPKSNVKGYYFSHAPAGVNRAGTLKPVQTGVVNLQDHQIWATRA